MRWRDSTNFAKDHRFEDAELRAITPNYICRYIKLKAFGNANADPEREYPTVGRASSSAQYKKSISKFMLDDYPYVHVCLFSYFICFFFLFLISFFSISYFHQRSYQEDQRRGNPTRSKRITTLIKAIKKAEVQGKGKASEARSPFTDPEYRRIMHIIEGIGDIGKRLFCSAVLRYQLAMGAQVDNTAKLSKTNIKCNSEPALEQLSLTTKLMLLFELLFIIVVI